MIEEAFIRLGVVSIIIASVLWGMTEVVAPFVSYFSPLAFYSSMHMAEVTIGTAISLVLPLFFQSLLNV